jgi:DNA-binding response OmpR family regulator
VVTILIVEDDPRIAEIEADYLRRAGYAVVTTSTGEEALTLARDGAPTLFTRAQLLDAIRGEAVESFDRGIDAHVKNVRRKIEPDPRRPRYILTVYGIGYKCADS